MERKYEERLPEKSSLVRKLAVEVALVAVIGAGALVVGCTDGGGRGHHRAYHGGPAPYGFHR